MINGRLCRNSDSSCIIPQAAITSTMLERMRGLLGSEPPGPNEALIIKPCSSVHTFGMKYPIDLAFLNKHWTIIKTVENLRPWRMSASQKASMVMELAAGGLSRLQLATGQQLLWQDANN